MWMAKSGDVWCEIQVDELVRYYIYQCDQTGKCVEDHLQATLEMAISFARRFTVLRSHYGKKYRIILLNAIN